MRNTVLPGLSIALKCAVLLLPAAILAGCGQSRDSELAEHVAAAQAAAVRAERAQIAAEQAIKVMGAGAAPAAVFDDDPAEAGEPAPDGQEISENSEGEDFDNIIVTPGQGPPAPPQQVVTVLPRS